MVAKLMTGMRRELLWADTQQSFGFLLPDAEGKLSARPDQLPEVHLGTGLSSLFFRSDRDKKLRQVVTHRSMVRERLGPGSESGAQGRRARLPGEYGIRALPGYPLSSKRSDSVDSLSIGIPSQTS